ncbi:hypothetical protein [Amaricoccus sp.]|uniref:hypothetical protein n=1 Tax=Amaricoccus sp. TaxID=1872485 RepID=UPI001B77D7BD|nr:hypothetical protein [Amaricoccus sp.]MBP7001891.1 hypothetical protein [Amaricoccus sp.]
MMTHVRQDDFGFGTAAGRGGDGFLRRVAAELRAWRAARAQRAGDRRAGLRLALLDEYLLRDIGVTRGDAVRLALGREQK